MVNPVLNFAWLPSESLKLDPELRVGVVPSTISAIDVAEIAERNSFDIVLVTEEGRTRGALFPDYLREHLPVNAKVSHLAVMGEPLTVTIGRIDQAGIDFHSESVNYFPTLRKCAGPPGHVTSGNPCRRHHIPTIAY